MQSWVWLAGRCSEDLVLCGQSLELPFQTLIIRQKGGGVCGEGVEFGFQVFDVTLLALAEGSLANGLLAQASRLAEGFARK